MKNSTFKRMLSMLMSLVIFVSSTPLQTFANDDELTQAIGIKNTLFSEKEDTECKYTVKLYRGENPLDLIDDFTFSIGDGEHVYLNQAGELYIPKNAVVNFLKNDSFVQYLKDNEITKLTINYEEMEGDVHAFDLYKIDGASIAESDSHCVEYILLNTF